MTQLKIGDKAPDFNGNNQNGETISLKNFIGKKVVLFFYPKASTSGCTFEANNLKDNYEKLKKNNYEVIGVSADSVKKQYNFSSKNELPYNLIADEDRTIINKYGVWGKKKMYGKEYEGIYRTTFLIDEKGLVEKIIDKVKTKEHTLQILENK